MPNNALWVSFKNSYLGVKLKNSFLANYYKRSVGDWRYPFLSFGWFVAGLLQPRRTVKINGISFSLSCTNWITHFRWFLFKNKEPEVRYFIDEFVKDDDVFFDIGANVGVFSIYAAKKKNKLRVFSFEPEYSNLYALKENIYYNKFEGRVRIYSVGVSDFNGLSELHLQDMTMGAAAHTESKEIIDTTDEGYPVVWAEGIHTVTIDKVCNQLNVIPNAIKIDTDGNEYNILKGAEQTINNKALRSLILEMPDDEFKQTNCYSILESAGFIQVEYSMAKTKNEIWVRKD